MKAQDRQNKGTIVGTYIPDGLFEMLEQTRKRLGMNRSRFIQYSLMRTLQELSIITTKAHQENEGERGQP
jgi:hypothetical protein